MFFASLGVVLGILYTGLPVIQHFALRLVLSQDDLFPFKYADFLEHTKKYRWWLKERAFSWKTGITKLQSNQRY